MSHDILDWGEETGISISPLSAGHPFTLDCRCVTDLFLPSLSTLCAMVRTTTDSLLLRVDEVDENGIRIKGRTHGKSVSGQLGKGLSCSEVVCNLSMYFSPGRIEVYGKNNFLLLDVMLRLTEYIVRDDGCESLSESQ